MKQKIIGLLAATALATSLATGCGSVFKYTVPSSKVEKIVEESLFETVYTHLVLGPRICKILYNGICGHINKPTEKVYIGISYKADDSFARKPIEEQIDHFFGGKAEIRLSDYKINGYGSVDEIIIDDNKITNPTTKQLSIANKIYGLVLEAYEKEEIEPKIWEKEEWNRKRRDEKQSSLVDYMITGGEKLDKLIEELKSCK